MSSPLGMPKPGMPKLIPRPASAAAHRAAAVVAVAETAGGVRECGTLCTGPVTAAGHSAGCHLQRGTWDTTVARVG
jgi:hypothetical protein